MHCLWRSGNDRRNVRRHETATTGIPNLGVLYVSPLAEQTKEYANMTEHETEHETEQKLNTTYRTEHITKKIMEYVNMTGRGMEMNATYRAKHKAEQIKEYVKMTERGTEQKATTKSQHWHSGAFPHKRHMTQGRSEVMP